MRNHVERSAIKRTRLAKPIAAGRDDKYFSKVIGKAFDILGILRASAQPLSLNELTARVGLAKSTVFRMLHTLEVSGYAQRDATGRYTASSGAQAWGRERLVEDLVDVAGPHMRALSREFGETVSLAARLDNRIEVVSKIDCRHHLRMDNTVGRILPPNASSLGKAIAAHASEEIRERLVRCFGVYQFTPHTITEGEELRREYERIRDRGYSIDAEESALDGRCYGAPIFNRRKEVIGALSVSVPKTRLYDKEGEQRVINSVRRAAQQISADFAGIGRRRT
jgi:DNA-binding IclR family transcriptional regulator